MGQNGRPRGNLESTGNRKRGKTLSNGFGIVRNLTNATEQDVLNRLNDEKISSKAFRRKLPLHLTVIQFMGMSRREQTAFHAGANVMRLERTLEDGVGAEAPRVAMSVELGHVARIGNLIYCEVNDERLADEQLKLAGQVALHGISPHKINRKVVPPHISIGHVQQGPVEEVMEQVETALLGHTVALERWLVYPDRYK